MMSTAVSYGWPTPRGWKRRALSAQRPKAASTTPAFMPPASLLRCRDPLATSSSSTATVVRVAALVGHLAPLLAPFLPGPAAYLLVDEALRHRQIAKIARRQHR